MSGKMTEPSDANDLRALARRGAPVKLGLATAIASTTPIVLRIDRSHADTKPSCRGGGNTNPPGQGKCS